MKSEKCKVESAGPLDLDAMAEEAVESYRRLVVAYVVGEAIDQGRLREVLILAGKGLDSFKADSDCLRQRYQAAKDIEAADAMQAEITAAGEAIAALDLLATQVAPALGWKPQTR